MYFVFLHDWFYVVGGVVVSDVRGPDCNSFLFRDCLRCCVASQYSFPAYKRWQGLRAEIVSLGLDGAYTEFLKGFCAAVFGEVRL